MKLFSILLLVGFFVILPLYTLNSLVMPALNGIQQQYSHAAETADRLAR